MYILYYVFTMTFLKVAVPQESLQQHNQHPLPDESRVLSGLSLEGEPQLSGHHRRPQRFERQETATTPSPAHADESEAEGRTKVE